MNRFGTVEQSIRALPAGRQVELAVNLASLVQPFAALSREGQPPADLSSIVRRIQTASSPIEIEQARRTLWATPELGNADEPDGLSWFSLGATVVWIYAADALIGAPPDGAINAFKRAADLLDVADETLGDVDLVAALLDAIEAAVASSSALRASLSSAIQVAVGRIAPTT